jgi:hypothetical protein
MAKSSCLLLILVMAFSDLRVVEATTWSVNINRFTTFAYYDGYPAIAQISDGKIWLLWSKEILGNLTLYYKSSPDLGITWSDEMNLTMAPANGHDQNPSIMQAENGTIWVAWASTRPPSSSEPPPEADFYMNATPASLSIPLGGSDNSTISITSINNFNDTINLYALNVEGVTSVLDPDSVYLPKNETVTSILTVTVEPTATPGNYTLTVMGNPLHYKFVETVDVELEITNSITSLSSTLSSAANSPLPMGGGDYEIFFKTSHDNGATWSSDIQLTSNTVDDLRPSIIQLSNGTIMLFWQHDQDGYTDVFYITTSDGISWSEETQLTTDLGLDKGPHATQTKDGRIWVVWASKRTGNYEIFYKIYEGSAWSSATRLTYSTNSDVSPSILQAVDDTISIFWSSSSATSDNDIYYMFSSSNGASWSESVQFTTDNNEDIWPAIAQTRDMKIWVVWVSNRADQPLGNWDVYYRTSLSGDVNEDGAVDVIDLSIVGMAYGKREGDPGYNPDADINKDKRVDMRDVAIITFYYGET